MTILTTGLLPIYSVEQYQKVPLIIIDKKVVTNRATIDKDVLTQMFAINEMHPYEIEWLSKYHPDYKKGLDVKLMMSGKQWQYLSLTKFDKIKLDMIWGHGFIGFFLNKDNIKSYFMPILIAVITTLLTFGLKYNFEHKPEKPIDNQSQNNRPHSSRYNH